MAPNDGAVTPADSDKAREEADLPRWATPSTRASFRWHHLHDQMTALCGERHYYWDLVENFAKPDAFLPCARCVHLASSQALEPVRNPSSGRGEE